MWYVFAFGFAAASGSFEHSPRLRNSNHMGSDLSINTGESQLREDLADAMRESPGRQSRDSTGECPMIVVSV